MKKYQYFLITLGLVLLTLQYALASDVTSDYVGCWQLDSNNLSDSSINGYNFTDYDTANSGGKVGVGSREFTRAHNDALNASMYQVDLTNSTTIEMWLNLTACPSDCAIIEWWGSGAGDRELGVFQGSAGAYSHKMRFTTHNPGGSDVTCDTSTSVSSWVGSWNFFQFVVNLTGNYIQVFVNNVSECRAVITGVQDKSFKFSLGNKIGGISTLSYSGLMDQIVVYKRALNETERSLNYNSTFGRTCFDRSNAVASVVNNDFVYIAIDKNITNVNSVWLNWSVLGNYSYSEAYQGGVLKYNGSNKYYNFTGLINNTQYQFNITAYWNSTLYNNTGVLLTTNQTIQTYINVDSITLSVDKNITNVNSVWLNWSVLGNYSYSEAYQGGVLKYNGSNKYYNFTGLINNTQYQFNITAYWNSTLYNNTGVSFLVNQTDQYVYTDVYYLELIYEVLEMIPIILLYCVLMVVGIWLMSKGQWILGVPVFLVTIGFDMYFWKQYMVVDAIFSWVFIILMVVKSVSWLYIRGTVKN